MNDLTDVRKKEIDHWVAKFPSYQKKSAVLMALRIIQDHEGYLGDEKLNAVAEYLSLPRVAVYEVASFYSMYRRKPHGKHTIKVCTSLSCCLKGAYSVVKYLEEKLGISLGQTTEDGLITLKETECLAACTEAPMLIVDDHDYRMDLTPSSIDTLVEQLQNSKVIDG